MSISVAIFFLLFGFTDFCLNVNSNDDGAHCKHCAHVMLSHIVKEAAPRSRYVYENDKLLYAVFADTPQCH